MSASSILRKSAQHIEDRAATRDQPQGERSMARTVAAFNALTGNKLSERDGWLFMVALKAARATSTATGIPDDYEDMAAYSALAGECVAGNDNAASHLPYPKGSEDMTVTHRPGDGLILMVTPGFNWVAQDMGGKWHAYSHEPSIGSSTWCGGVKNEEIGRGEFNPKWKETLRQVRG